MLSVGEAAAGGAVLEEEHVELRATVRRYLGERFPESEVRRLMGTPSGFDRATWSEMATGLGLQGLAVPEQFGGSGYGWVEQGLVFHELGRALADGPYLSTVGFVVPLLLACGDEAAQDAYLPRIASGDWTAAFACFEAAAPDVGTVTTRAERTDTGYVLTGTKPAVLDGADADLILVLARGDEGTRLFAVEPGGPGPAREPLRTLDLGRRHATLTFERTPARAVGTADRAPASVAAAVDALSLALAAETTGISERALQMSVAYARERVQFNRPIGSFQAIKHTCAEMLLAVESCRALVEHACWAADHASGLLPALASAARVRTSTASVKVTYDNIHVHGGIGFTWEHPAHLFFRRARADAAVLGGPEAHRSLLADRVGL
ncbi:hypothetical protein PZ61_0235870 [Streptomyces sp. MNU77]|nr:hypothetical protein PZ61_0235870 [Streptomyces sp. MNU77]